MGFLIFRKELIIIATKLSSSVTYVATGTQTTFSIPFDYLRKAFVYVAVDGEVVTDGFSVEDRTVVFTTAPTKDTNITIYRSTPTSRLVAWGDATILKARDMTVAEVQQLHLIEENQDWTKSNSIVLNDEETAWQGKGYPLSNIADPTDTQDVVTKNYLENTKDSFTVAMNSIKTATQQYADEAKASKTAAEASAASALNSVGSASTSATNASNSATNAETSATNAKTAATNAANSAAAAATSATTASNYASTAQSASSTSSNFATNAKSSANEALTYRNNASTFATNAKTYMETAKDYSENVNVFVPSVSSAGVISWTNKAGLTNPTPVSVKGATGATGAAGKAATIAIGTVTTGEAGTSVSVTNSGTTAAAILNFTIPKGKDGKDGGITVDTALSSTSTNPVQNKVINAALEDKANISSLAAVATSGSYNDLSNKPTIPAAVTVDTALSSTSTNAVQNKAIYSAINSLGQDLQSLLNAKASTSVANTWTAVQTFNTLAIDTERFNSEVASGSGATPTKSCALYTATSAFTLDMSTIAGSLSNGQSTVFTARFFASSDYVLFISNAGTLFYTGSASDVAIKSTGTLLNIFVCKNNIGVLTSIVQATALSAS